VKIRVVAPGELVELSLQLGPSIRSRRAPEHFEVIIFLNALKNENGPRRARSLKLEDPATPRTTCRIHSSTSPGGLTNVKPPVSPCCT